MLLERKSQSCFMFGNFLQFSCCSYFSWLNMALCVLYGTTYSKVGIQSLKETDEFYIVDVASKEAASFFPLPVFGFALIVLSGVVPRLLLSIVGETMTKKGC